MCACTREMLKGKRLPSQGNGDNLHRQACPFGLLSQRLYSPRSSLPFLAVWDLQRNSRDSGSQSPFSLEFSCKVKRLRTAGCR